MKRLLPIALCLFLFVSCSKHKDLNPVTPTLPETYVSQDYKIKDIKYSFEQGDGKKQTISDSKPLFIYTNETSLTQIYNHDPAEGVMETSRFKSTDIGIPARLIEDLNKSKINVKVPFRVYDDKDIFLGEEKWLYQDKVVELPARPISKESVNIPANTKLTVKVLLKVNEYTLSYKATFVGQKNGNEIQISGKWTGTSLESTDVKMSFEDIVKK